MSQKSIYKKAHAYKPRKLVQGFCVPSGTHGKENLICHVCACQPENFLVSKVEVTFDGDIRCNWCNELLTAFTSIRIA